MDELLFSGEDADADANAADPEGLTVGGTTNSSSSAVVGGGEVEFEVEAVNVGLTITSGSEGLRTPASLSPKFGGTSISASPLSACSASSDSIGADGTGCCLGLMMLVACSL